ncbi:MAG: hypothetical protein ACYC54_13880 [Sedimentisphaerales bacterium]
MNEKKTYRYILRYQIDPQFDADNRIDELLAFCKTSKTKEVMLIITAEELATGHPTIDELQPYVIIAKKLKSRLHSLNIDLSLNPWFTIGHVSRGRKLKPTQNFTLMVGETGANNGVTACPLCLNWQNHICTVFAYLAKEIMPTAIWIEDDWRLHNHDAILGWGGCFCNLHLERFAQATGERLNRQELLNCILAPGKPHPWRKIWIDICNQSLIEPAIKLKQAIKDISQSIRVGIMTSTPDNHSAEGRDWNHLQTILGDEYGFLIRPHLPPYTETTAIQNPPSVTRHTIANLNQYAEIYPELESSPRCGTYSRSSTFASWQCFHSVLYGSKGITINHFDMLGNGISLDNSFTDGMAQTKPLLDALLDLEITDSQSQGVNVLFSPKIAEYIHSSNQLSFNGICQDSTIWSKTLYTLAISHKFISVVDDNVKNIYAVSGQTLRCFSDEQVKRLLSAKVLLDASSIEILYERGFGELIGIDNINWQQQDSSGYSYETIQEDNPVVYGLAYPRMTAQRCSNRLLAMRLSNNAEIRSTIHHYNGEELFPGLSVFKNALGGTAVCLAYPLDGNSQFFMAFFNIYRRIFLQNLLFEIAPDSKFAVAENTVHIYRTMTKKGLLLAVINFSLDPVKEIIIRLPEKTYKTGNLSLLDTSGDWIRPKIKISNITFACIRFSHIISPMEWICVLLS